MTIQDDGIVTREDLGAQFLISEENVGQNRAEVSAVQIRRLNPRVNVIVNQANIMFAQPEYYSNFNMVIATDLDADVAATVNAACRLCNRPFYAAGSLGFYGYIFADLISHEYVIERAKSNVPTVLKAETPTRFIISSTTKKENGKVIELVTKRETYSPFILANSSPMPKSNTYPRRRALQVTPLLSCLRALWEFNRAKGASPSASHEDLAIFTRLATQKHQELSLPSETLRSEFLRSFLQNIGSEIAPVTAFLGGQLAQDVINALGQREQPIQNFLLFDGEESKGLVYALHPMITDVDGQHGEEKVMPAMPAEIII